jgi:nucleotide-binding universal stress UspA family protein
MTMRRSIVVGVDGSPSALQAVAWAAQEAARRHVPLSILAAMPNRSTYGVPIGLSASFFEQEELEAHTHLDEAVDCAGRTVPEQSLDIDTRLGWGGPIHELLECSTSALMVVVGGGRRNVLERMFLGSVSAAVVAHAHAPVVVVRDLPHVEVTDITGPVVVGVDGSEVGEHAVTAAFEEAALRGVELVAVHAWSDLTVRSPFQVGIDWETMETSEKALLSESLAGYAERYPDVPVRPVMVMDQPAHNLREQAAHAQLLVIGRRGRGGFSGMLLGSTSRALIHTVTCPLLIVR